MWSAKCPVVEMSVRGNVLVRKCPVGEVSGRRIVRSGKCPSGKCPSGKCQSGNCSHTKYSTCTFRTLDNIILYVQILPYFELFEQRDFIAYFHYLYRFIGIISQKQLRQLILELIWIYCYLLNRIRIDLDNSA